MNAISPLGRTWASAPRIPTRPALGYENAPTVSLIDSPSVSFLTALAAAVPSFLIANKEQGPWANFFWVVGGLASFKAMIDFSKIRAR